MLQLTVRRAVNQLLVINNQYSGFISLLGLKHYPRLQVMYIYVKWGYFMFHSNYCMFFHLIFFPENMEAVSLVQLPVIIQSHFLGTIFGTFSLKAMLSCSFFCVACSSCCFVSAHRTSSLETLSEDLPKSSSTQKVNKVYLSDDDDDDII